MRKIQQYRRPKYGKKLITLAIMIVTLITILVYGRYISDGMAEFFVPDVAVTDAPAPAVTDEPAPPASPKSGTVVAGASKNAAQDILNIISKGLQK